MTKTKIGSVGDTAAPLVEGRDFYFDANGLMVLTADWLRRRGYCCGNGCRHCPWQKNQSQKDQTQKDKNPKDQNQKTPGKSSPSTNS